MRQSRAKGRCAMVMSKRWLGASIGVAVAVVLGAATLVVAQGAANRADGKGIDAIRIATSTAHFSFTGGDGATKKVPGARHRLPLTADPTVVRARFTATISCSGDPGRCSAFVNVFDNNAGGAFVTTMNGVFHMDSTFGGDAHESHVAESWVTLPPGDYDFQVEILLNHCCGGAGTFTADIPTWMFTLERLAR